MELSIIIVNYNTRPFLEKCLAALTANTVIPHEIIIVDNHSHDDSRPWLETLRHPRLRVILNRENRGYAAACNQGLALAAGRFLVTMNPDVIVPPRWDTRLAYHLERHPAALMIGPKSLGIGGKQWAGPLNFSRRLAAADRKFAALYARQSIPAKFLIGCLVFFDRRLPKIIGPFDENLPLGADDFDLALRIREKGYQLRIAQDVLIKHTVHASFHRSDPADNEQLATASWQYFRRKWDSYLRQYGWERLFEDAAAVFPGEPSFAPGFIDG
ncbi:MAG: glycosyltransferase family 2 protein [Firmicutes bacterium]|nr:glycosyltransferase family 2 protein [Bacillota bacterium]